MSGYDFSEASGGGAVTNPASPSFPNFPASAYGVEEVDFVALEEEWLELLGESVLDHIFFTPFWVGAWWGQLGDGELRLLSIRRGGKLAAVAPLVKRDQIFCLAADNDLCDYADIAVRRGEEKGVASAMLEYMGRHGTGFRFGPLLPQSSLLSHLAPLAQQQGYAITQREMRTAVSLELPTTWEDYLQSLSGKDRHEVRRKLRRLYGADGISFTVSQATPFRLEQFFFMFRASRADKEEFLTPQRESFFRTMMGKMEDRGHLRLYFLEVNEHPVAAALCFDYRDTLYLYNNGYDPQFSALAPGLMSKVLALQEAIQQGKRVFDFLGGAETYKLRLGG
ncbi:MAG: GNAT family N-acetyltransferase, partial [Dehalococcoidia bacterium]|nr:GNAT family N-acetyltransferase [Dehalococcoidia bacterium]